MNESAKQVTGTQGNEPPLIGTGAEYIVPQLASRRFVQKAKKAGKVIEVVKNKYITVKYNDGTTESFDCVSRMSRTKMASFIPLDMNTLEVGNKVSKNSPVAWTNMFDRATSMYCSGANTTMAIMNYIGGSHEDSYVISENFSEKMKRDIVREVSIIVPPDVKILNIVKEIGGQMTKNDILVEFQYDYSLDSYLEDFDVFNDNGFEDDDLADNTVIKGGPNSIKLMAKSGEITSIQVFVNTRNSTDKQVLNLHKQLVTETRETIKVLEESYEDENDKIKASDNVPLKFTKVGGHKIKGAEFTGSRIVYLIKQAEPLKVGDKLAARYGTKGVISSTIIPKDLTPKSKRHNLDINTFISPSGIYSRKSVAMIKELYLGKVIYFLDLKVKEMAKDSKIKTEKIIKLLLDVYNLIGGKDSKKIIEGFFKNNTEANFRKRLKTDKDFSLFFPIKPFTTVEFTNIHKAADMIDVELDEYVYIPALKTFTKAKVPVGVMYMQVLEQTSQSYASIRSTGKYQSGTRQATKGKSNQGGQAIGQLDINALLTYDSPAILDELLTLRSDEHQSKQEVFNNIINTGSSDMPVHIKTGATENLLSTYMTSMGLITL